MPFLVFETLCVCKSAIILRIELLPKTAMRWHTWFTVYKVSCSSAGSDLTSINFAFHTSMANKIRLHISYILGTTYITSVKTKDIFIYSLNPLRCCGQMVRCTELLLLSLSSLQMYISTYLRLHVKLNKIIIIYYYYFCYC